MPIPLAVPVALGAAGIIGQTLTGLSSAAKNYRLQRENLEWQKSAQKTTWEREDNAIQRRAADLEAAGLSKTLAAGSAAQASAPIRTEAPQYDSSAVQQGFKSMTDGALLYLNAQAQQAQIDKTNAETSYIRTQEAGQSLQNAFQVSNNPLSLQKARQEIDFNQLSNPKRLLSLDLQNTSAGIENKNKMLDTQIKTLDITKAEIDVIGKKLENELKTLGIEGVRRDLLLKELAIDMEKVRLSNAFYSKDWYNTRGLPDSFNLGIAAGPAAAGSTIGNMLQNLLKRR